MKATMIGTLALRYQDYDVYERIEARNRHHETRCRWCGWRSGWLVSQFRSHEEITMHLVDKH